ncbi:DUF934 domain-containing protein [Dechloromonas sp. ARDL1]|uniref:DUF934 domain-containing protein n=1 Tax=Dechloromonas sp. ARDL1 TaxID=3322121 RepID=UPI003DA71E22
MKRIIKDGAIVEDAWETLATPDVASAMFLGKGVKAILPLAIYLAQVAALADSQASIGVLLGPNDDPDALLPHLKRLPLIAVNFPAFADGRGYSTGRLLRSRYGFAGELRAVGDVLRDQLYFLERCGFSAFVLRDDQDLEAALTAFGDYAWQPAWQNHSRLPG